MYLKLKLICIILILTVSFANSQNDGAANTGLAFLKLGAGARGIAMGDAFSPIADDATAIIYNPARLTFGVNNNLIFMHNIGVQDLTTDFIATKFKIGKLGIGVGLMKASVSDIEVRVIPGPPLEKFTSQNISVSLAASYEIYTNLSLGVTSKLLYEKIYIDEASGVSFDIGTSYSKDNLNFSFLIGNIGSMNELRNKSTKLPTLIRLGTGYLYTKDDFSILGAIEGFKVLNGGKFHLNVGVEGGYKDFVFLRAGYQSGYENKFLTTGIGIKYKAVNLDYAFVPQTNTFGINHIFSVSFNY